MMAQRYSQVLERRQERQAAAQAGTIEELPEAEAERYVTAYLDVRRGLKSTLDAGVDGSEEELRRVLREALDRGLRANDLDRTEFQEMQSVYRAWQAGSPDVPPAFRRALGRRADELQQLDLGGYDPLAP